MRLQTPARAKRQPDDTSYCIPQAYLGDTERGDPVLCRLARAGRHVLLRHLGILAHGIPQPLPRSPENSVTNVKKFKKILR